MSFRDALVVVRSAVPRSAIRRTYGERFSKERTNQFQPAAATNSATYGVLCFVARFVAAIRPRSGIRSLTYSFARSLAELNGCIERAHRTGAMVVLMAAAAESMLNRLEFELHSKSALKSFEFEADRWRSMRVLTAGSVRGLCPPDLCFFFLHFEGIS